MLLHKAHYKYQDARERKLPEYNVLEIKGVFYDPSGWDSDPQDVLLGWEVPWGGNTIHISKVAAKSTCEGKIKED